MAGESTIPGSGGGGGCGSGGCGGGAGGGGFDPSAWAATIERAMAAAADRMARSIVDAGKQAGKAIEKGEGEAGEGGGGGGGDSAAAKKAAKAADRARARLGHFALGTLSQTIGAAGPAGALANGISSGVQAGAALGPAAAILGGATGGFGAFAGAGISSAMRHFEQQDAAHSRGLLGAPLYASAARAQDYAKRSEERTAVENEGFFDRMGEGGADLFHKLTGIGEDSGGREARLLKERDKSRAFHEKQDPINRAQDETFEALAGAGRFGAIPKEVSDRIYQIKLRQTESLQRLYAQTHTLEAAPTNPAGQALRQMGSR